MRTFHLLFSFAYSQSYNYFGYKGLTDLWETGNGTFNDYNTTSTR